MFGWFKKEECSAPKYVYSVETRGRCHCGCTEFSIVGFRDTVSCIACGAMFFIGDRVKEPVVKLNKALLVKPNKE